MRLWKLVLVLLGTWSAAGAAELRLCAGQSLTRAHLEELLAREGDLAPPGRRFEVSITSPKLPLKNPSTGTVTVRLADLRLEEEQGRFDGALEVLVDDEVTGELSLGGLVRPLIEVPVLLHAVAPGQTLGPGHLGRAWIAESSLRGEFVLDAVEIVGREADRRLMPGRPIRAADVRAPRLVRKGDDVALVYRKGPLEITTRGKALEDGSSGQTVKVANATSEKQVRGVVVDHKRVHVGPEVTP